MLVLPGLQPAVHSNSRCCWYGVQPNGSSTSSSTIHNNLVLVVSICFSAADEGMPAGTIGSPVWGLKPIKQELLYQLTDGCFILYRYGMSISWGKMRFCCTLWVSQQQIESWTTNKLDELTWAKKWICVLFATTLSTSRAVSWLLHKTLRSSRSC